MDKFSKEIKKLETEIDEIKANKIYENAFEWRFEFPEVLNDEGDFVGFDVVIGNPPYFSISHAPELKQISDQYKSFASSGDIYSLFIERSLNILRLEGTSSLIISNKWMRANYGETLRAFLIENTNPTQLIDFGQNLIFDSAIVHTSIISFERTNFQNNLQAVRFSDGFFDDTISSEAFLSFIKLNMINSVHIDKDIWNIIPKELYQLKQKAENNSRKLSEWDINIFRGFLTGLNNAFIITKYVADELINDDPKNEDLIKPILRGRDTRKYYYNDPQLYVIGTFTSLNLDIDDYPSLKNHLSKYLPKLKQTGEVFVNEKGVKEKTRKKTFNKWFETQDSISYYEEFVKPKIIFSEIVSEPQFYYDEDGFYPEATVFFVSGSNLKYLTALLNSKATTFLFKSFYMGGELVGKIRYKKAFLEQVPIPIPDYNMERQIDELVDEILAIKKQSPTADTTTLESQIDQLVYELYGLTEEEIEIVEGSVNK